jgi:hypothetical protein
MYPNWGDMNGPPWKKIATPIKRREECYSKAAICECIKDAVGSGDQE